MTCCHAMDGNFYCKENINSLSKVSLLPSYAESSNSLWFSCKRKYLSGHKCVTSKAALLILCWSLIVSFTFGFLYQLEMFQQFSRFDEIIVYFLMAFFSCFSPLAGCLADLKYGRYKTIVISMYILLIILLGTVTVLLLWFLLSLAYPVGFDAVSYCELIWAILVAPVIVAFNTNIIQFGMDQLYDSPVDHQSLFSMVLLDTKLRLSSQ